MAPTVAQIFHNAQRDITFKLRACFRTRVPANVEVTAADNARGQNRSKQTKLNTRSRESVRLGDAWDDYLGKCHSTNGKATTRKDLESLGIRLSYRRRREGPRKGRVHALAERILRCPGHQ